MCVVFWQYVFGDQIFDWNVEIEGEFVCFDQFVMDIGQVVVWYVLSVGDKLLLCCVVYYLCNVLQCLNEVWLLVVDFDVVQCVFLLCIDQVCVIGMFLFVELVCKWLVVVLILVLCIGCFVFEWQEVKYLNVELCYWVSNMIKSGYYVDFDVLIVVCVEIDWQFVWCFVGSIMVVVDCGGLFVSDLIVWWCCCEFVVIG